MPGHVDSSPFRPGSERNRPAYRERFARRVLRFRVVVDDVASGAVAVIAALSVAWSSNGAAGEYVKFPVVLPPPLYRKIPPDAVPKTGLNNWFPNPLSRVHWSRAS